MATPVEVSRSVERPQLNVDSPAPDDPWKRLSRNRLLVAAITVGGTIATLGLSLFLPTLYRAETKIVPADHVTGGGAAAVPVALMGAAQQFGLGLPSGPSDPSVIFVEILKSRRFARSLARLQIPNATDIGSFRLLDVLDVDGDDQATQVEESLRRIRGDVLHIKHDSRSGTITIAVHLEDPEMAAAVANASVTLLDELNRQVRRTQASQWLGFIESRLAEVETMLEEAEVALGSFYGQNRVISDSPQLKLQEGRLLREARVQEELFITLKSQREIAKVEEVKNLPVIAVLDEAFPPVRRFSPRRGLLTVLAAFLFGFLGVIVALFLEHNRSTRTPI